MYYKGSLRKEVTPIKLKAFLELTSYNKYDKNQLQQLIYPFSTKEKSQNFNLIYNFAKEINLIEEISGGKVIYNEDSGIEMLENGLDEEEYRQYMREVLFKSDKSLFNNITNELLSYDMNDIFFDKIEDMLSTLQTRSNIKDEDMLAYRFWSKYLGYSYNLLSEFLIINPFKYINNLNKKIAKKMKGRLEIRSYIKELRLMDNIFETTTIKNEISQVVSVAIKTLESEGKIKLILENDADDLWRFKNLTEYDNERISHIELEGYNEE